MFTANEVGVFADGANGHNHVRLNLADLLWRMFRHHPRGGDGVHWKQAEPLYTSLRGEMPDDASDEADALDLLNEHAVTWEVHFAFVDGDLLLLETTEYARAVEEDDHARAAHQRDDTP